MYKVGSTGKFLDLATGEEYDPRDGTKSPTPNPYNADSSYASGVYFADQPFKYVATGDPTDGEPKLLPDNGGRPGFDHTDRFYSDGGYLRNNFSMQRNSENFNVYVGVSDMSEDGVFGNFIDGFKRNTFRLNTDVNLPFDIKLGFLSLIHI